jgi:hypothetical protein
MVPPEDSGHGAGQRGERGPQLGDGEVVDVALGGGDAGVAEELGESDDVAAASGRGGRAAPGAQVAHGVGVAQGMRGEPLGVDAGGGDQALDEHAHRAGADAVPAPRDAHAGVVGAEEGPSPPRRRPVAAR